MIPAIPSLSVDGWITDKNFIMVKLYEHFLSSDKSQSNVYDEIGSLKYIINEYKDALDIKSKIEETLYNMYSNYFKTVDVIATMDETDNNVSFKVDINVVDYDDKTYSLSRASNNIKNSILIYDDLEKEMNEG